MSRKANTSKNATFESSCERSAFTKICKDMIESKAWKSLKPRHIGLYVILKSKYKYNPHTKESNKDEIVLTSTEAEELYGDLRTFRNDLDILIDRGFIKQTFSGAPFMKANKYGFSDKWKLYGTDNSYIPEEDKRYKKKR